MGNVANVATKRLPRDPSEPLTPGTYELLSSVSAGDARRADRAGLERALRLRYGGHIDVLDYAAGAEGLRVRFRVNPSAAAPAAVGTAPELAALGSPEAFWLPAVFSAAAVLGMLYLIWKISAELVEFVELVSDSAPLSVGAGGAGVGLALLGAAALAWALWPRRPIPREGVKK